MADNKNKMQMTPEEVQQTVLNQGSGQAGNMNGYQPVTPVNVNAGVPQSAAWRNVQQTGNAKTDYNAMLGAQPGAYNGMYQQQVGQTMNNLLNQRPMNYDVNTDALYQQIKDNYIKQGRQAMMNTQGAAAALTGGYGNSYGALAGQQAYQESLGNLSAQIPQLYQLAYQRYLGNENSQRQNLAALQGLDESDYQRYQYDTQQYEQKLADAYAKANKGGGGGGKKKTDPRTDAEWLIGYAAENGWDPDDAMNAIAHANGWSDEYTKDVGTIVHGHTDYQREQARKEENNNFLNTMKSIFGL